MHGGRSTVRPMPPPEYTGSQFEPASAMPSFVDTNVRSSKRPRLYATHGPTTTSAAMQPTAISGTDLRPLANHATGSTSSGTNNTSSARPSVASPQNTPNPAADRSDGRR